MERLNRIARILRYRRGFRGYLHLKIIPGASAGAVEEAVSLSTAVSLNIETPGAVHLAKLSNRKRFIEDIVEPIKADQPADRPRQQIRTGQTDHPVLSSAPRRKRIRKSSSTCGGYTTGSTSRESISAPTRKASETQR